MRSVLLSGAAFVAAAALGLGALAASPALASAPPAAASPSSLAPASADEPALDPVYGVCRGTDPECFNEEGSNGWVEGEDKRVLIWSRTAGPRHAHLGSPLPPGLNPPLAANNVAQSALKAWLEERGIAADYTEDLTQFTDLDRYQTVINLSGNRDTFDDPAQERLTQYLRGGGGFVGIHNAFGAEYDWPYYEGLLGGANFLNHGPNREGTVEVINNRDASTSFMPEEWLFKDEWYNLSPFPTNVNVLLEVDRATSEVRPEGHGEVHPVSWCQYYDGARAWLTTLGHDPANWTDAPLPGKEYFKEHVLEGIQSAMGVTEFCAPPVDDRPDVALTPRTLAGKAYLSVAATNNADIPVTMTIEAPFGAKTFADVAPGRTVSVSLNTRATLLPAGDVLVTAEGERNGGEFERSVTTPFGP